MNEHNPGPKKCKNTEVTNLLYKNSNHKIDFANPKILGTARNRTQLFILETLSIDKLKPNINVDQPSITLYLFNMWLFFSCFLSQCAALVSQEYLVCLAVEQQLVYISRFYSIAALFYNLYWNVSTFIRDLFFTFFTVSDFNFYWWWT